MALTPQVWCWSTCTPCLMAPTPQVFVLKHVYPMPNGSNTTGVVLEHVYPMPNGSNTTGVVLEHVYPLPNGSNTTGVVLEHVYPLLGALLAVARRGVDDSCPPGEELPLGGGSLAPHHTRPLPRGQQEAAALAIALAAETSLDGEGKLLLRIKGDFNR